MRYLRRYIRKLLREDLGQQVFSLEAPKTSRHHGTEINTPEENDLWWALKKYMLRNKYQYFTPEILQNIDRYVKDPKYNDVLKIVTEPITVYRGTSIDSDGMEKLLAGVNWKREDKQTGEWAPILDQWFDVNFEYHVWDRPTHKQISGWTNYEDEAEIFAGSSGDMKKSAFPFRWKGKQPLYEIVLATNTLTAKFFDMHPLYKYHRLSVNSQESEYLALSPPIVNKLKIYWVEEW